LDLACGTGRITIALAKSGLACIGLDGTHSMLEKAITKSIGLNISYTHGDMRDFKFEQKFDFISMAGNSFQALLTETDQEMMLTCVRSHLEIDGVFAFNTRNLIADELRTTNEFEFWHNFTDPCGDIVKVYGKQTYNPIKNTVLYTTKRIWPNSQTTTDIELRFTKSEKILDLLNKNGFEVISLFGDFNKSPFIETSEHIIVLAKLKTM
jgi:2-polyprenyl-3-methyl-5-hydroxy-6-metoxy-1,4-benzoquinol methylase